MNYIICLFCWPMKTTEFFDLLSHLISVFRPKKCIHSASNPLLLGTDTLKFKVLYIPNWTNFSPKGPSRFFTPLPPPVVSVKPWKSPQIPIFATPPSPLEVTSFMDGLQSKIEIPQTLLLAGNGNAFRQLKNTSNNLTGHQKIFDEVHLGVCTYLVLDI